jgi:hypothetical protein
LFLGLALGLGIGVPAGFLLGRRRGSSAAAKPRHADTKDLDDLEMRAKVRGLFDLANVIDRLGKLQPRLTVTLAKGAHDEVTTRLSDLFRATAASCQRAYDLNLSSRQLATTEAKERVREEEQRLTAEAATAIAALEAGVDRAQAAAATEGVSDDAAALADLNTALDRQLEVARRVDERMRDLEGKAAGDLSYHERRYESLQR